MTNQEQIEQAERIIEKHKNTIYVCSGSIKDAEERIQEWQAKLSDLKKQAEPKEGEWWYMQTYEGDNDGISDSEGVLRIKSVSELKAYYTEHYDKNEGYFNDYLRLDQPVFRPATTEEITYFMGLHAERLGIKEGVEVDRGSLCRKDLEDATIVKIGLYKEANSFSDNCFLFSGTVVRDSSGTWATVVTEKPENGKLKAKIAELEERIQKAKDILDGK